MHLVVVACLVHRRLSLLVDLVQEDREEALPSLVNHLVDHFGLDLVVRGLEDKKEVLPLVDLVDKLMVNPEDKLMVGPVVEVFRFLFSNPTQTLANKIILLIFYRTLMNGLLHFEILDNNFPFIFSDFINIIIIYSRKK